MSNPSRKTIAEHAIDVLRETDNPAVMYGDSGLLDTIAVRANVSCKGKYRNGHPMNGWASVLAGLERSPLFEKKLVRWGGKTMRSFTPVEASND